MNYKARNYFVLALGLSALLSLYLFYSIVQQAVFQPLQLVQEDHYNVEQGASLNRIVRDLVERKLIENSLPLKIYLCLYRQKYAPKSGHYQLSPGQDLHSLLLDIAANREKTYSITLVEGQTWQQWYSQLETLAFIDKDQTPEQILTSLGSEATSLEGILLPETYQVRYGTKLSALVGRLYREMQQLLASQWQARQGMLPIKTPYEALILASIIEKETAVPNERSRIAAVFVNRLRDNMRLQTDPTVIYGLGADFDGNITRKHLRQKTLYNTYVIKGLPPTPIAMPGRDAIHAALNPSLSDEFYFVAKGDGSHHFSQTLQQHNHAVRKYQLGIE